MTLFGFGRLPRRRGLVVSKKNSFRLVRVKVLVDSVTRNVWILESLYWLVGRMIVYYYCLLLPVFNYKW